jgi:mannosyltransferase
MQINRSDARSQDAAVLARPPYFDSAQARGRFWVALLLAALLGLGLALRLYRLGAQSLWLDEGSTWAEVTGRTGKNWGVLVAELWSPNAGYPLYHLLLRAWIALAGDSEWALRLPSAVAGTLALAAIFLAAREVLRAAEDGAGRAASSPPSRRYPLAAVLLLLASPFALWYAQEAKTYSLVLLTTALQLWALLRALRLGGARAWALYLGLAALSFFAHRLALLALVGGGLAYLVGEQAGGSRGRWVRRLLGPGLVFLALVSIAGSVAAVGSEAARTGAPVAAGPLTAIWLTFGRLSLDRGLGSLAGFLGLPAANLPALPGALGWLEADARALLGAANPPELPRLWLLPSAALLGWGLWLLLGDARRRDRAALAILCSGAVPLLLFGVATAFARLYEPRYMMIVLPAWVLTLAYPLLRARRPAQALIAGALLALALAAQAATLLQPEKGLFSGDPVKEQWRESIAALARRAQPDDLLILHPYYVRPLWDYYAPRVTADPLPQPVTFPIFGEGYLDTPASREQARDFAAREYEPFFDSVAQGRARALMLLAPDHARMVDPPLTLEELQAKARREGWAALPTEADEYGLLGLRFHYPQRSWPCGGDGFVGVRLMCQSFPELFGEGRPPGPQLPLAATFGGELALRGYTLKPTTADGSFRPGGGLAVTLFWEAAAPPRADYTVFLHLCQDCGLPPLASDDAPPLLGYPPAGRTSTWIVGDPVHDERLLRLPADLPPGRYTLLAGVYPLGNPAIEARLPVLGAGARPDGRLPLAEVEIR